MKTQGHLRKGLAPMAKQLLMIVANPAISTTLGWPVGFWAAELTHPYRHALSH